MSARTATPRIARFGIIIAVLMFTEALSSFEYTMVLTALPTISKLYGIVSAGWLITAFLLVQAATAAVGARLGDIFGRRELLMGLIAVCAAGSLISATSSHIGVVIFGRAMQGASGAILPLCFGIARQIAPAQHAPFWIGCMTAAYTLATAAGYLIGGYFADGGAWRSVFWFSASHALLLLPLLFLLVPRLPGSGIVGRFDWVGGLLFVPAIASILYGITQGSKAGWHAPVTWAFVAGGGILLAVWAFHEARHPDPLIDVRLLRRRPILLGNIAGALTGIGMFQLPLIMLQLLQQPMATGAGFGLSATYAAILKTPSSFLGALAAMLAGYIAARSSSGRSLQIAGALALLCWGSLLFVNGSMWGVVIACTGAAFASAMILATMPNIVLEGAPLARSSEVTGLSAVIRGVFSAIGAQLVVVMLGLRTVVDPASGRSFPAETGYLLVFGMIAVTGTLIIVLGTAARQKGHAQPPYTQSAAA